MPSCPACDNRFFNSREALQQHLRTSSAPHPLCVLCNRRFIDETGYNSHMAAKHPPLYPCEICSRTFTAQFALEDHYRGSTVHPNCARCGKGFKDAAALEEHNASHSPEVSKAPIINSGNAVTSSNPLAPPNNTPSSPDPPAMKAVTDEGTPTRHDSVSSASVDGKTGATATVVNNATTPPEVDRPEDSPTIPAVAPVQNLKILNSPPISRPSELPAPSQPSLPPPRASMPSTVPQGASSTPLAPIPFPVQNAQPPTSSQSSPLLQAQRTPPRSAALIALQSDAALSQTPALVLNQQFASPLQDVQPPPYSSPAPLTPPSKNAKLGHTSSASSSWTTRDNIQAGPKVVPPLNLLARARTGPSIVQRPFGTIATQQGPLAANGGFHRWLNGVSRGSSMSSIDSPTPATSLSRSNSRGKLFSLDAGSSNSSPFGSPSPNIPLSRQSSQDSIVHDMGEIYSTRPTTNLRNSVTASALPALQTNGTNGPPSQLQSQVPRSPSKPFRPGPSSLDLTTFATDKPGNGSVNGSIGSRRSSASSTNPWTWNQEEVDITSALSSAASTSESPKAAKYPLSVTINNTGQTQSPDISSPIDLAQLPELSPFPNTPLGSGSSIFDSPRLSSTSQVKMASQWNNLGVGKWVSDNARGDGRASMAMGGGNGNANASRVSPVPEESDIVMESQLGREREKEKERIKEARERSQSQSSVVHVGQLSADNTPRKGGVRPTTRNEENESVKGEKIKAQLDLGELNADMDKTLKKIESEVFGKEFEEDLSDAESEKDLSDGLSLQLSKIREEFGKDSDKKAQDERSNLVSSNKPSVVAKASNTARDSGTATTKPEHQRAHEEPTRMPKPSKGVLGSLNKPASGPTSGFSTPLSAPLSPSSSIASSSKMIRNVPSPVTPPSDIEEESSQLAASVLSKRDEDAMSAIGEDGDLGDGERAEAPAKNPLPSKRPPLHCRICKIDRCLDVAATFCGHVFCYGCITQAIINKPSCPVCATPTLLYCIFRLDLAS
ncbi:hypothetical protein AX16_011010 [Volvariella volvacea WC 439]|nr:hypothetical protein AX16_011010 [Volvariella volvacea WC 439]